jgi:hypothetical protein
MISLLITRLDVTRSAEVSWWWAEREVRNGGQNPKAICSREDPTAIGFGGRRKFDRALVGGREGVGKKAPPFDFAQGRLSRKERENWGTRPDAESEKKGCLRNAGIGVSCAASKVPPAAQSR